MSLSSPLAEPWEEEASWSKFVDLYWLLSETYNMRIGAFFSTGEAPVSAVLLGLSV